MNARTDAWYALESNRVRRKARMRRYMSALVVLGQRHGAERRAVYQSGIAAGLAQGPAAQKAYAAVRDKHRAEFDLIRQEQEAKASEEVQR